MRLHTDQLADRVLEHDRVPQGVRQAPQHRLDALPADEQIEQLLLQRVGALQQLVVAAHDRRVYRAGDLDEPHPPAQRDDRQPPALRFYDHAGRDRAERRAELDREPGGVPLGELLDELALGLRVLRQGDARRQDELAAAEQAADLRKIEDVDPAQPPIQLLAAAHHLRQPVAHDRQREHLLERHGRCAGRRGDGGCHRGPYPPASTGTAISTAKPRSGWTVRTSPGLMTIVVVAACTIAGPSSVAPGASSSAR